MNLLVPPVLASFSSLEKNLWISLTMRFCSQVYLIFRFMAIKNEQPPAEIV
jgi:hypothetical protein